MIRISDVRTSWQRFGNEITAMLYKEFQLEWRQKYALGGLFTYAFSTVFIVAIAFRDGLPPPQWNVLYWIILLFLAINAVARSFMGESRGQLLYLYQLAGPVAIILAKIIYNAVLLIVYSLLTLGLYLFFVGNPLEDPPMFLGIVLLSSTALAATMTLLSALAAQAGNSTTLLAVLSFPVLLPQLLAIVRLGNRAMQGILPEKYVLFMLAMLFIVLTLSVLLFPYLWRE